MHQVPLRQNGPWKCCVMGPTFLDPPLSYFLERGLSISISYLPTRLSFWLSYYFWVVQRKKTHVLRKCQKCKSDISLLQPSGGHSPGTTRLVPSRGSFYLSMPSQFGTSLTPPPPPARLVPRDQPVPEDQPAFTRTRPDRWSRDGPRVCLVQGQRQLRSMSRGPEVSGVVVEDLGRMGQDRGEPRGPFLIGWAARRPAARPATRASSPTRRWR